jgi:pyruvate/2-oxoglutarate/acetoin dehydrogenase E1 component
MYGLDAEVPEESFTIPFGKANIVRDGDNVTVVAIGRMVHIYRPQRIWRKRGVECEVIDPRTTSPLNEETILESVANTG